MRGRPASIVNASQWIGTTPTGMELQPPRLEGVFDTDPYLYDGSARTLEEVFSKRNVNRLHGKVHELSDPEKKDLLQYVR